ncbi:MAG TPA: hypothetical protein VGH28_19855 [Polyangiaceae bacterium]|jgi:hypothetical protein
MAAEWILQGYAYDAAELAAFVGSKNTKLAKKIARAAKDLHDDDRLDLPLDEIVVEIAEKKLSRAHATSYRIALEAIMNELGERLDKRLTTYGLKERLAEVLAALGQKTLAAAWKKPAVTFPASALARDVHWPMAMSFDARAVAKAAAEARTLPKRAELEARTAKAMKGDEDFVGDTVDVVAALARIVTKAAAKKRALMVLIDGEQ